MGGVQPLGFYLTPISGQAPWFYLWKVGLIQFYFHPTWDLVPILYFQRFSPSAKQASTKGAHFFSWETCGMFISFRATETLLLSLWNVILCWTFTSRTNIEIDLKKHATKTWIPASHPVHLQFQQIKPVCPTLRYQPLCKIGVKKLALSLFTWDSSEMFTFIIFVKSKSRTTSPAHQGHTEIDSKKGYQILETNTSPCPIFALETWRGSLKITSVPANLDRWISLRKLALKVRRNCVLGKIVMTCLSTYLRWKPFKVASLSEACRKNRWLKSRRSMVS